MSSPHTEPEYRHPPGLSELDPTPEEWAMALRLAELVVAEFERRRPEKNESEEAEACER